MKIFVINGENPAEKVEIEISELAKMSNIRESLRDAVQEDQEWSKDYYRLIYKNIILNEEDYVHRYGVCKNDEVWYGRVEKYLKREDVIVEVFLAGYVTDCVWIVVKRNDAVSTIRSAIERFVPHISHIWDISGKEMSDNNIVGEIDANECFRLVVSYGDQVTFDECCKLHDAMRIRLFYDSYFTSSDMIPDIPLMKDKLDNIRQSMPSNDTRLNEDLQYFASSFVKLTFLFGFDISNRILEICVGILGNLIELGVLTTVIPYFHMALWQTLGEYSATRQHRLINGKKLIEIVVDALDHLIRNLEGGWEQMTHRLIDSFTLRSEFDYENHNNHSDPITAKIGMNSIDHMIYIQPGPKTIIEIKKVIAFKFGINVKYLYCINCESSEEPKDEDQFNYRISFQIMKDVGNFDKVKMLDQGGFGKVYQYVDKLSDIEMIIKKPIGKGSTLHSDIFIGSHLYYTKNLKTFSGIIRNKDSVNLAMDYLPGGSLTESKRDNLQEREIIKISYQILTQITELHRLGIIHYDITPNNIVFDEKGNAKLIDLGLAKYVGPMKDGVLNKIQEFSYGNNYYKAPEVIKELPYSNKIDIWSFGMVLVYIVTGKHPVLSMQLKNIEKYEFKPVIPISEELSGFINLCLTVDPDQRPTSKDLIQSKLIVEYLKKP